MIDKNFSKSIELVRHQYSGNTHRVIKGVEVVTCVYVNPQIDQFWIIDYRFPNGSTFTPFPRQKRESLKNKRRRVHLGDVLVQKGIG
jgi:hypothetical protein